MVSRHVRQFKISGDAFKALVDGVNANQYNAKLGGGFIIDNEDTKKQAFIEGRFVYTTYQRIKDADREDPSLEVVDDKPVRRMCNFRADASLGVLYCTERRADMNRLEDVFSAFEGVSIDSRDFCLDLQAVLHELRNDYKRVSVDRVKIKDYLGRDGILATASFKIMEPGHEDDIIRKYSNDLLAIKVFVQTDEAKLTLTMDKKGTIRVSDEVNEHFLDYLVNLQRRFHEEVEAEIVEV